MRHQLSIQTRVWPLSEPFVISRGSHTTCEVIVVHLAADGHTGRGEAVGVDYHGETIGSMRAQIEGVRAAIERGVDRRARGHSAPEKHRHVCDDRVRSRGPGWTAAAGRGLA